MSDDLSTETELTLSIPGIDLKVDDEDELYIELEAPSCIVYRYLNRQDGRQVLDLLNRWLS